MELQAPILHHLASVSEPIDINELAHALRILEPGDTIPQRLRSTLTGMVRHQQVKRHHHGDGVLRYSSMVAAADTHADVSPVSEPAPSTMEPATAPAAPASKRSHHYETNVSARVLDAFVAGEAPIRRTVIESRISPVLSTTQVVMALQALRLKGKVQRHGTTSSATWSRVVDAAATPEPPRVSAVHHALLNARLAIDAALQLLEA